MNRQTHSSVVYNVTTYDRLEFLGDSVLDYRAYSTFSSYALPFIDNVPSRHIIHLRNIPNIAPGWVVIAEGQTSCRHSKVVYLTGFIVCHGLQQDHRRDLRPLWAPRLHSMWVERAHRQHRCPRGQDIRAQESGRRTCKTRGQIAGPVLA